METEDDSLGCWRVPIGNVRLVVCKTKKKQKQIYFYLHFRIRDTCSCFLDENNFFTSIERKTRDLSVLTSST